MNMYTLRLFPHTGLSMPADEFDGLGEARDAAALMLRRLRRAGHPVSTLTRGALWESREPDGCLLVPDTAGLVELTAIYYECRECGGCHDDDDAARACCGATIATVAAHPGDVPDHILEG